MAYYLEQLYTNCLAEAAYYLESEGEALIIDPLRDVQPYLDLLSQRGARLKYVVETHFHADFVSGHVDLARATGATILYGPGAVAAYPIHAAQEGDLLELGRISLEVIHTPGHTLESICLLLRDEARQPVALFTGDTLFVGDVGRPDLAVKSDLTKEDLARRLFHSVQKLKALPDHLEVYPGHGPGSACGKQIGPERTTRLGIQKATNYAFQADTEDAFVAEVLRGQTPPPAYFFRSAAINKGGYEPIAQVLQRTARQLSLEDWDSHVATGAVVLDTRDPDVYLAGTVPGALSLGLCGQYAIWAGSLLDAQRPLLLITEPGKEDEAALRLARVGYENSVGVLAGGIDAWRAAGRTTVAGQNLSPEDVAAAVATGAQVLDVRNPAECESQGSYPGSLNIPLAELPSRMAELDAQATYVVHCAGGYRSVIAIGLLRQAGFTNVVNQQGGWAKLKVLVPARV